MVNFYMERRHSKRISISLEADLISDGKSYAAIVRDISEQGLHIIITLMKNTTYFTLGTKLRLKIHHTPGETVNLNCKKRWSFRISPHGPTMMIGMEITDSPPKYKEFFKTL
ncbi:MAG: PilZ domain-containing protein [Thermodesulfovibrionia bacterium]|nr:PilZ domain-containing protein [Thermodesulfovibrionia bacterium]